MEKYGKATRESLLNGYSDMVSAYDDIMDNMMLTVDRYDREFEKTATYRPKGIVKPEDVFAPIAAIEPTSENDFHQEYAKQLVLTRKREDYQGKY